MFSAYYAPATVSKGYFVDSVLRSTSRRLLKYLGCVNIQISKVEDNRFLSFLYCSELSRNLEQN
jgi:hypothetical protein